MPYETVLGNHELASRLSHTHSAVRSLANKSEFYVPAGKVKNLDWLEGLIVDSEDLDSSREAFQNVLAIDGSQIVTRARDGMPSVMYGFAQVAAVTINLAQLATQSASRFVDPTVMYRSTKQQFFSLDFPVAGAFVREGIDLKTSWREAIHKAFTSEQVELMGRTSSLQDLLFRLRGTADKPATEIEVVCPECKHHNRVGFSPSTCSGCGSVLYATDVLRIHEEVTPEGGSNEGPLGRLRSVLELLAFVGLAGMLYQYSRGQYYPGMLFMIDGPLAVHGPPAKLRGWAQDYVQSMGSDLPVGVCGIEKSGALVDWADQLAKHDLLKPMQLVICGHEVNQFVRGTNQPLKYGKETYWGRQFVYRAKDGRVVSITVPANSGAAYDERGGQPGPQGYSNLKAIIDVIEMTGSSMYRNGLVPIALAHGKAAYPIGMGSDVLTHLSKELLGVDGAERSPTFRSQ